MALFLVKHHQLQVSRSGFIALSKPAVLKIAVTGLSLYGVTCTTNFDEASISFKKGIGLR